MPDLVEYLSGWATVRPAAPAVEDRNRSMTYGALDEQSRAIAASMRERGIRPGNRVAVWARKSIDAVVAIYAILKCGAAYVPLDPSAPASRVSRILTDCAVACLVTDSPDAAWALGCLGPAAFAYQLPGPDVTSTDVTGTDVTSTDVTGTDARIVTWERALQGSSATATTAAGPRAGDLAYILYTSGSTGAPKGVMLSHRNACAFTEWAAAEFGLSSADRVSSHAPFCFDLSVLDLFATCRAGGCVVLVPEPVAGLPSALNQLVAERRISVWYSVPNALLRMVSAKNSALLTGSALRLILFAGEVFPVKHLRHLRQLVPEAALYNLYGPTETNVCTFHQIRAGDIAPGVATPVPIGRPCPYARTFLMDLDQGLIAERPGAEGELCVAGDSVMAGYWRDERLTGQRTVLVPQGDGSVLPAYRTGDLVCVDADLNYVFRGRRDTMVKIRGYRVELGEVESVLAALAEVREAACVVTDGPGSDKQIEAYVIPQGHSCDVDRLRKDCAASLPRYMVPERIRVVPSLPRTATGKIDRRALAAPPHADS